MAGALVRRALRRSLDQVRHVSPVRPAAARGLVADVYARSEREFGMLAPPVALHSPAPEVLAACWMMLRETLLAEGRAGRAVKEAVATGVSLGNTCPYCVGVHSATLQGLVGGGGAGDGEVEPVTAWARASGVRREAALHGRPFPQEQAAELVGVAVTFQYLNRMVNVFLDDTPLPPRVPAAAHGGLMRVLGWFMRLTAREVREPGASLDLLPAAPLPGDLSWAAGAPNIAGAFARTAEAVEEAGRRSVPEAVRDLVTARLAGWDGGPAGLGRAWADDAVSGLPVAQRPAGRLALLTAIASHQVGGSVVDDFRAGGPDDGALIELTAWASLAAARRIGGWMCGEE
ncbi:carboxymuconolactone decarboxylase family protein [Streptosporangium carneum]|uniref:Alkyl hydroperoxide reductase AhpD n=1 Tax=Streptosporangium carneum TaxID=47481 RepID=A0A9W6I5X7_9ACTN|nr:carboxymuconolactone decarboxylase family protein [Streptosporangium carneum]GLK12288.1 alkyl hydroperoxide reductase AhpD [Streptosporangium carneum]